MNTFWCKNIIILRVNLHHCDTKMMMKRKQFFSEIMFFFRDFKPRRSRPSETALRLRSFPRGGPPLGEKNFKKIKINYFFLRNLSFLSFLSLCFLSNFLTFHKKIIYIFKKVRKFWKIQNISKIFENLKKKKLQKKSKNGEKHI